MFSPLFVHHSTLQACGQATVTLLFATTPAFAQASQPEDFQRSLLSMLLVVITLIASGVLALWLIRKRGGAASTGPMRIIQAVHVGPRERVMLVELDGERLLIGVTGTHITLLTRNPLTASGPHRSAEGDRRL